MPRDNGHARLSPSAASRWLLCPGSVELCANVVDHGGEHADRGTAAHACAQALLEGRPVPTEVPIEGTGRVVPVTVEIADVAAAAVDPVLAYREARPGTVVYSEHKVEIGAGFGLPEGHLWGTSDVIGLAPDELLVCDFKFGYNPVGVDGNPQLILYALGALDACGWLFGKVRLWIVQPAVSPEPLEVVYTTDELEAWREAHRARVLDAHNGGALVPSEDACRWCRGAAVCPAFRDRAVALAKREFDNVLALTGPEIADLLGKIELVEAVAPQVRAHAQHLLSMDPNAVPGYKLVAGEKRRRWKDEAEAVGALLRYLDSDDVYERKLKSPSQIEKTLAEEAVKAAKTECRKITKTAALEEAKKLVAPLTERPAGGPTLVRDSDPRPALPAAFAEGDVKKLEMLE